MLRERKCIVKYGKDASNRTPVAVTFCWDAQTSWFAGCLEVALVKACRRTSQGLTCGAEGEVLAKFQVREEERSFIPFQAVCRGQCRRARRAEKETGQEWSGGVFEGDGSRCLCYLW